jgi:hypothetical protein
MRKQSRRETTPDEAMAALRGERNRPAVVRANTGAQSVSLARSRFGDIRADVYVEVIGERRTLPVTERQARDIIVRAGTRDSSGVTLELLPFDESSFDGRAVEDPRSE